MADFNRFDICEAWWCYAVEWHGGQSTWEYEILGRLANLKFKPRFDLSFDALEENGKEIYMDLVAKHQGAKGLEIMNA